MKSWFFRTFALAVFGIFFLSPCQPAGAQALSPADRAALEAQLAAVQAEAAQAQADLTKAQSQSASIQRDIDVLTARIKAAELNIKAKNLLIKTLGDNIVDKQNQINDLEDRISANTKDIESMFRTLSKAETNSLLEVLLSNTTISGFIDDTNTIEMLQSQLSDLSAQLGVDKKNTTDAKNTLVEKRNAEIDARYVIQQEQAKIKSDQAARQQLLSISKQNEKAYGTLLAQKKKEADAISAQLFSLAGGSNPIPFGTAYLYAKTAYARTGVDPAFLLAVLTQETNLGSNQGTCYLSSQSGAGLSVKSGKYFDNVMNPTRDVPPFLTITSSINVDPYKTVVSCPQAIGWGGAMGPAQFIASTWMLFATRIASALGISGIPNPWNPQHAFMAAAIYLGDLGANKSSYTAEMNAACKYYSGSSCSKSSFVASYGRSVMALANTIQTTEINKLQGI